MEARQNVTLAPSVRVRDMQKSLDFYTKTLGFKTTDKLTRQDGRVVHASVGFDSPLLMLSPVEHVRTAKTKEDLSKNKVGVGVEFYVGISGLRKLDEFFTQVKTKGVTVINEPRTEPWGDRIFTISDPDGYTLTFSEHVKDVTPEERLTAFDEAHQK